MGGGEEEEEVGGGETGPRFPEAPKLISKPKIKSETYSSKITATPHQTYMIPHALRTKEIKKRKRERKTEKRLAINKTHTH